MNENVLSSQVVQSNHEGALRRDSFAELINLVHTEAVQDVAPYVGQNPIRVSEGWAAASAPGPKVAVDVQAEAQYANSGYCSWRRLPRW